MPWAAAAVWLIVLLHVCAGQHEASGSEWTSVIRDVNIEFDLEGSPLQIKTNSSTGSEDEVWVKLYTSSGSYISFIAIYFGDRSMYYLHNCTSSSFFSYFSVSLPEELEKVWTIYKTDTALTIYCNDVLVLDYLYSEAYNSYCVETYSRDVEMIKFRSYDDASVMYRAKSGDTTDDSGDTTDDSTDDTADDSGDTTDDSADDTADDTEWTSVIHDVNIEFDLEGSPLQIKTNSTGSEEYVGVYLYTSSGSYISTIAIYLFDTPKYYLGNCTRFSSYFSVSLPEEQEKVWTIYKTDTALKIYCNDVLVLDYLYSEADRSDCVETYSRDVEMIKFSSYDRASEMYRAKPGDTTDDSGDTTDDSTDDTADDSGDTTDDSTDDTADDTALPYNCTGLEYFATRAERGAISSPLYPSYYPDSAGCTTLIETYPGDRINLEFAQFDLEGGSTCEYDYLEIYDGYVASSSQVHRKFIASSSLGRKCGTYATNITSSGSALYIKFVSDSSITKPGYLAYYSVDAYAASTESTEIQVQTPDYHNYTSSVVATTHSTLLLTAIAAYYVIMHLGQ